MQLPFDLQEKINKLYSGFKGGSLKLNRQELTNRYKQKTGQSVSLIENEEDSVIYAISRMPTTYTVISTLFKQLTEQGFIQNIKTICDIGSGTGAGFFALKNIDENLKITLVERDKNMISIFDRLSDGLEKVLKGDFVSLQDIGMFDLVMSSYVLSEMNEPDRVKSVAKMLEISNRFVLLIDTGTPTTYGQMMKIKELVTQKGYEVVAPCMNKICPLENDYCQFYARVERSALQKLAKDAVLSYEDEKYFYLLIDKLPSKNIQKERVIRRPIIESGKISIVMCSQNQVSNRVFTKKDKEAFKRAKKSKINDLI